MFLVLAVLLRIAVNPLSNVFQKLICSKGQSPFFTCFLSYMALSLACLPFITEIPLAELPLPFWGYSALVGLFGAAGNGFLIKAMQSGELSVLGPVNSWKSVVGIVFAMILLHEFPNSFGILGVVLILAGSYFVFSPKNDRDQAESNSDTRNSWLELLKRPAMRYRVAAMVFAAIEAVFIKKVILYSDPNAAFVGWCWGGMLFSLPLIMLGGNLRWGSEWKLAWSNLWHFIALAITVGLMQWSTNYVFAKMPVGYALALFQLSTILSVIYGWLIFHETGIIRKLVGSAIMIAGSVQIVLKS